MLVLFVTSSSLLAADQGTPLAERSEAAPSVGSWLNTPPDRQAVAFDASFNRIYFNAEGKVVGRYNRLQKKFQAGEYYAAQWHNIGSNEKTAPSTIPASKPTGFASGDSGSGSTYSGDTDASSGGTVAHQPPQPKPAEIFRRGETSRAGGARAKVIEAFKP
jgi:hypothetical protein